MVNYSTGPLYEPNGVGPIAGNAFRSLEAGAVQMFQSSSPILFTLAIGIAFLLLSLLVRYVFRIGSWPYALKPHFLTDNEREFYFVLVGLCARAGYVVFSQVRVADLLEYKWYRPADLGRVSRSVDFVICDSSLAYVAAIELDDSSHRQSTRVERDNDVNALFRYVGLPLYRVATRRRYTADFVQESLPFLHSARATTRSVLEDDGWGAAGSSAVVARLPRPSRSLP